MLCKSSGQFIGVRKYQKDEKSYDILKFVDSNLDLVSLFAPKGFDFESVVEGTVYTLVLDYNFIKKSFYLKELKPYEG